MSGIQIFLIISALALFVGLYKAFEKAGVKGWKALIPGYNFYVWIKLIGKPWWWLILVLIPTVGFYMLGVMIVLLSNGFGKRTFKDHVLAVLGYFLWLPYLGFSKSVKWQGMPAEEKKRPLWKEWGEAGVFAIVAATLIRTFFFEAFVIPSSSMEGTLRIGDYLFVSKLSYGSKVPSIPLSFPFVHNTLPMAETKPSYVDWIKLPYLRFPALSDVERNDIVVFNFPEGDTVWKGDRNQSYYGHLRDQAYRQNTTTDAIRKQLIANDNIVVHPVDKEDNYVKRCVAVAGDRMEVRNKELFINGAKAFQPKERQFSYLVKANDINTLEDAIHELDIEKEPDFQTREIQEIGLDHLLQLDDQEFKKVQPLCSFIQAREDSVGFFDVSLSVFPHSSNFKWNRDNFGPLVIPKQGMKVNLSLDSLPLWDRIISVYEGNKLEIKNGSIYINGAVATTYTFKQDYYFMMGDNRHNSLDSRYWGYVPADHIVGKPVFVWFSKGDKVGFRPERMMCAVSKDGLSRSYLWLVVLIIAGWTGYSYWKGKKQQAAEKHAALKPKKK
jgi:signal peptidase I